MKKVALTAEQVYQFIAQKDAKVNIALAESSATIAKASLEDGAAMRTLTLASKEDSAVMRMIAAESKKDSSAMKTISILGMFFLPGTFVAVGTFTLKPRELINFFSTSSQVCFADFRP
jgi:hypothetical protein